MPPVFPSLFLHSTSDQKWTVGRPGNNWSFEALVQFPVTTGFSFSLFLLMTSKSNMHLFSLIPTCDSALTVFPKSMHIYLCSHAVPYGDFSILAVIQLFCLVSSCPYGKDSLFVNTDLQQLESLVPGEWARNHGGSLQRVCTAMGVRLFWHCVLWRLYSNVFFWVFRCFGVLHCFVVLWTVSDIVFKTYFYTSCDFFWFVWKTS